MTKLAIGINLDRCIGCHTCATACKMQNNVPDGMLWNRVITEGCDAIDGAVGEYPNLTRTYVPLACQHCENPACLKVCPTGATYKDEQGRVEIDYDRCIGCRMCMAACPFNARVFNWEDPQRDGDFNWGDARVPVRTYGVRSWNKTEKCVEKCTLCGQLTSAGKLPACVKSCAAGARFYGDLDDPNSELAQLRATKGKNVHILLEEKGTKPQVFYFDE